MLKEVMREIFYNGIFCSDTEKISMDEPIPKHCYGYRTIERQFIDTKSEKLYGKWKQVGNQIIFGRILTLADVSKGSILYENMVSNNWDKVVKTCSGNVIIYTKDMEIKESLWV